MSDGTTSIRVHATTVSLNGTAVMIRGASGSGKSDLALQLLEESGTGLTSTLIRAVLVADDQTELRLAGDQVFASAPSTIRSLLEVRGHGLLKLAWVEDVPLVLVVDLTPAEDIERLPDSEQLSTVVFGKVFPLIRIDPAKVSAAARLRTAWAHLSKMDKTS